MPDGRRMIYWDAACFLSYINAQPDRLPTLEALLGASARESGDIKLYTSALSKVEVAFAASEQKRQALDPEVEERIAQLWSDPDATVIVEYHDGIGDFARDMIRSAVAQGWSLKPLDAIHLATAQWLAAVSLPLDEFHTYDAGLLRWSSALSLNIVRPYLLQSPLL